MNKIPFRSKWVFKPEFNKVFKKVKSECFGRTLDVGCGFGELTYSLPNCFGIDIKDGNNAWSFKPELFKKVEETNWNLNEKFDCVVLNCMLEYVENYDLLFKELRKASKRSTVLVINVPTPSWKLKRLLNLPLYFLGWLRGHGFKNDLWICKKVEGNNFFKELLSWSDWTGFLQRHGLKILKVEKLPLSYALFKCKWEREVME